MIRPTTDNDPELCALQRLAQAMADAPDKDARERLIAWAVDRFDLFDTDERRVVIDAALSRVCERRRQQPDRRTEP